MDKGIVGKPLKDMIIDILGKEGLSINSLSKVLQGKGVKVHRLFLTGYLTAMKDFGILREREIRPAKVFSVIDSKKEDIYQIIGKKARDIDEEEAPELCLYALYRIFNRPIFVRELNHAGVGVPRQAKKIVGEERKNALNIVLSAGLAIPKNNSAYVPEKEYRTEFEQIVIELMWDKYNIKNLVSKNIQQKKIVDE